MSLLSLLGLCWCLNFHPSLKPLLTLLKGSNSIFPTIFPNVPFPYKFSWNKMFWIESLWGTLVHLKPSFLNRDSTHVPAHWHMKMQSSTARVSPWERAECGGKTRAPGMSFHSHHCHWLIPDKIYSLSEHHLKTYTLVKGLLWLLLSQRSHFLFLYFNLSLYLISLWDVWMKRTYSRTGGVCLPADYTQKSSVSVK